jgi:hypothetical protein
LHKLSSSPLEGERARQKLIAASSSLIVISDMFVIVWGVPPELRLRQHALLCGEGIAGRPARNA